VITRNTGDGRKAVRGPPPRPARCAPSAQPKAATPASAVRRAQGPLRSRAAASVRPPVLGSALLLHFLRYRSLNAFAPRHLAVVDRLRARVLAFGRIFVFAFRPGSRSSAHPAVSNALAQTLLPLVRHQMTEDLLALAGSGRSYPNQLHHVTERRPGPRTESRTRTSPVLVPGAIRVEVVVAQIGISPESTRAYDVCVGQTHRVVSSSGSLNQRIALSSCPWCRPCLVHPATAPDVSRECARRSR